MANILLDSNTAAAADSVIVFKRLGSFAPKPALKAIEDLGNKIKVIETERGRWLAPEALAEIKRRREAVTENPTAENLAAMSNESADQLSKRYEATADEYHRMLTTMRLPLHDHYVAVLAGLVAALDGAIEKATADNARAAAGWGVKHDAATDPLLLSLRRLKESAIARLDNKSCVMHVDDFRQFLGLTKSSGFFA
jgi:hypothetical protein